ncbi:MAG: Uncharacterised protein [Euryarchaeota archaeon UBA443]|jgi:hypothetical protein|nr:MAG: Uncharacterised protein [Euryarchaeota archaeon UBA443]|tara:strand:+ start:973 stop:1575 length:603 start_codon:yes stop_codon:yes gene_type:complete
MREDSDTTVIVCRQDFAENRILYTYGRHAKELKNDGKTFLGPVFESMIKQAGIVDDAEEVGLMVHIRLRPKLNDDRWYQIDFVMQDETMAYYSNFDGRLPSEMVHVVPLSGGLPRQMYIAVEALDEVAYAHAIDAKLFQGNDEMGLPEDQTSLRDFGMEIDISTEPTDNDGEENFVINKIENRAESLPLPGPTSRATGGK